MEADSPLGREDLGSGGGTLLTPMKTGKTGEEGETSYLDARSGVSTSSSLVCEEFWGEEQSGNRLSLSHGTFSR
jgi:hypothetical protein